MKCFKDLKFRSMPAGIDPSLEQVKFMNAHLQIREYTVSVSFGSGIYGTNTLDVDEAKHFEVAVFDDEGFIPITEGRNGMQEQVAGWMDRRAVNKIIKDVETDMTYRKTQVKMWLMNYARRQDCLDCGEDW